MFLKQLNLTNFRNYSQLELEFDSRPTVLVGGNGAGKSNLLEAIYLLSTTKSLRVETENELIKENAEFAKIEGVVANGGETELLIIINQPTDEVKFKKRVIVNGIPRRTVDFIGNLPAVIFYPQDINLVTGSPSLRRWHIDLSLAQIDPVYKKSLTLFEQFLAARNRVLKRIREGQGKLDELDYWTAGLIKEAKVISDKRKEFFEFINKLPKELGDFKFMYQPSELSLEKLKEANGREVAAAATLIGPHRDDLTLIMGGKNLAHFGSRGEQRMGTLAFKLAQFEYMAHILGKRPTLLLDDVFSELDENHRRLVGEIALKQQTIISTIEMSEIPNNLLDKARILQVEEGKIV
ncbi:DNA replication/repair protein RecF [Candidatus Daviesbacteria bacterium]|nr:DNA replication/repair protein RecF [Candidatus Daviesbacteria bacterium]